MIWTKVKIRTAHAGILDQVVENITEKLEDWEAIEIIPMGAETEIGDYGRHLQTFMFLILYGTPFPLPVEIEKENLVNIVDGLSR